MSLLAKFNLVHSLNDKSSRDGASLPPRAVGAASRAVLPPRNRRDSSEAMHSSVAGVEQLSGLAANRRAIESAFASPHFAEKFSQYVEKTSFAIETILYQNKAILLAADKSLASLQGQIAKLEAEVERLTQERELLLKASEQQLALSQELNSTLLKKIQDQSEKSDAPTVLMDMLTMKVRDELLTAVTDAHLLLGDHAAPELPRS